MVFIVIVLSKSEQSAESHVSHRRKAGSKRGVYANVFTIDTLYTIYM
jgi:hypothetical protein